MIKKKILTFTTINQTNSKHISLHPGSKQQQWEGVEVMDVFQEMVKKKKIFERLKKMFQLTKP